VAWLINRNDRSKYVIKTREAREINREQNGSDISRSIRDCAEARKKFDDSIRVALARSRDALV